MTFETLQAEVTQIYQRNPDVQAELGWDIYQTERAIERLTSPVNMAERLNMPQAVTWRRRLQEHIDHLAHLRELLTVADTVICPDCGALITEPHWNCDSSTDIEIPF